jgi:site-specific DNA-methyltransferase (adenine-specific)
MADRTLFYGDNLSILRQYIADESVDLIYLDPPFNSNRSYNVLFKDESGRESDAQITAFDDSWQWGPTAERTYEDLLETAVPTVAQMISAMRQFMGANQMMAYLVMMTARLAELHRVLAPTGSLYLHCDSTASHYLKILLDAIFGAENFQNEIIWKRTSAHNDPERYGRNTDTILFYSKTARKTWNSIFIKHDQDYIKRFKNKDPNGRLWADFDLTGAGQGPARIFGDKGPIYPTSGRHWMYDQDGIDQLISQDKIHWTKTGRPRLKMFLDETEGVPAQVLWDDIPPINSQSAERLGYPTQKPLVLLERIIQSSSNPGDVLLDPFSGCGTAITAAEKLGRRWIGIDITHLAIAMHKNRLKDMYGLQPGKDYQVFGEPQDIHDAHQLAADDRYQFQWWALSLVQARPTGGQSGSKQGKKGADQGIDGVITFVDDASKKLKRVLVQVKSGHVKSGDVRDLRGVLDREKDAPIGVLITLEPPSPEMVREAVSAGFYRSQLWQHDYPRLQICTIEDLLCGQTVLMPPSAGTFKKAQRQNMDENPIQVGLDFLTGSGKP